MKEAEIKKRILKFFSKHKEEFISGEDLSEELHFSRAYVWKYINKLREDGYIIEAVPHLGYRLDLTPDKLYEYEITSDLDTKIFGKKSIHYYETVGSTNDIAYKLAEKGEPEGTLIVSESQIAGKGRMGRSWVSPKGSGIYISLILRPDAEMDEVPQVTLAAGLAVIKAIYKISGIEAMMKWPNDVLINGKKVCGILTEIKAQPDKVDFLILGIGINVNTGARKLPQGATSLLLERSGFISRVSLIKSLLEELEKIYIKFKKQGFAVLRDECKECSLVLGKYIKLEEHHKIIEGLAVDLDEKGALIVRDDNGILKRVFSGDVNWGRS